MKVGYAAKLNYYYLIIFNYGFDKNLQCSLYISLTDSKIVIEMMRNDA